jgi:hypothetical protein
MVKAPVKAETVKAVVMRDFWPTDRDEDRVRAGRIIDVSKDQLIDGLTSGVLAKYEG